MKNIKYFICLYLICLSFNAYAQLSTNEKPVSFSMKLDTSGGKKSPVQTVSTPVLDMAKIEAEDKEDEEYEMPPRFGYPHKVNYDLNNSGTWYTLPNGDKLWQLNVTCPNALSVNFCYDKFWIPEGGKFFVYSKDKKHSIGAFTSKNNKGTREQLRGFATGLIYGNDVVLEYYQPKEVTTDAIISIEYIVHGYRYINIGAKEFGASCDSMVNINCEEGENWQFEKKAVAMIVVNGDRICTGSLINTTNLNQAPLFLTANHCINDYGDAAGNCCLDYFEFYWNYEAPGCDDVTIEPTYYSTIGATILANNVASDFALLRLTEDPINLSSYTPFYLGWDCSGQSGLPGVGIHHPVGDVKKISTVLSQPVHAYWNNSPYGQTHWRVAWKSTPNGHGTTQGGSSGSPLLTATHKVIGQLHGGSSGCESLDGNSYYGKYNVSWVGYGNDSICRRLNCWIDSLNTGAQTLEGLLIIPSSTTMTTNRMLYSNIRITSSGHLTIQSDIELMGNSRLIVETGGQLTIDGGTLSNAEIVLKVGSSLRIINNGIIETRNGFEAPVGTTVDIVYGKII